MTSLPATNDARLARESEHLDALQRMRTLDAYYAWTFALVQRHVGRRLLDAGCGVGSLAALAAPLVEYACIVDFSSENLAVAAERFRDDPHVEPLLVDLENHAAVLALRDRRFDTVTCLDVLEHLVDDVGLLECLRQVVVPGGRLLVKVPACPWLFGSVDEASGHVRRYTLDTLGDTARRGGWEVEELRYMNLAGVLPYWLKSRVLRRQANFSQTFSPKQLTMIRASMPWLRRLDRLTGPPVGQSAILVARRT